MKRLLFALFFTVMWNARSSAAVAVLTQHNDLSHTGDNLQETILNTNNVSGTNFGLVYTRPVDDQVYAQPLIMTNVTIPGQGVHNVLYVVTVNDSVYAYDADNPEVTAPYWHTNFLGPNVVPPNHTDLSNLGACDGNYNDYSGNIGIVSTPVIDPVAGTIFLVARTKENGANFVQRLHALDITTGAERPNSPVIITATYPGNGDGSVNNVITFDSERQNQRAALALVNGIVYITWASHCDLGPYHGWVIGYNETTLQQSVVYNANPDGSDVGIWMSGQGPSADTNGNIYLSTGNGSVGTTGNPGNLINRGESFLKLTRNGTNFTVASWFTPYNWQDLENGDIDLGAAGLLLIPGTTLAFGGGKQGEVYLVNRDNMGGLSGNGSSDTNVVQTWQIASYGQELHGAPVWWDGPTGSYAYVWVATDVLHQYPFNRATGMFNVGGAIQGQDSLPDGQPGGIMSISANGSTAGSGIVWASLPTGDANQGVVAGILRAYDAANVSHELWNSTENSARDAMGNLAKFVPPTIANGKVYVATFSDQVDVYGLLTPVPEPVQSMSYAQQPTNTLVNSVITPEVQVEAFGTNGQPDPGASITVSLDGTGTLGGTLTQVADANGIAHFSNLTVNQGGQKTLTATAGTGAASPTNSTAFTIFLPIAGLAFTTQPGNAVVGAPFGQPPVLKTVDQYGNPSVNGLAANLYVTVSPDPTVGPLVAATGKLTYNLGTAGGNGVVTCTNLQINGAGPGNQLLAWVNAGGVLPPDITSGALQVWLDAADTNYLAFNGDNVSAWKDKSGHGLSASQNVSANQPGYHSESSLLPGGGNPGNVLGFNGGSQILSNLNLSSLANTPYSIFTVVGRTAGGQNFYLGNNADGTTDHAFIMGYNDSSDYLWVHYNDNAGVYPIAAYGGEAFTVYGDTMTSSSSHTVYQNGVSLGATAVNELSGASAYLTNGTVGGWNDTATEHLFTGDLAEVIVYTGTLASGDVASVDNYLLGKWTTTPTVASAVSAPFTVQASGPPRQKITSVSINGGLVSLTFSTTPSFGYRVLMTTNLSPPVAWIFVPGTATNAAGSVVTLTDSSPVGLGQRFYRVVSP